MDQVIMILKDRDRTQAWLCRRIGISQSLFSKMKRKERTITDNIKDRISKVLQIRSEILFK